MLGLVGFEIRDIRSIWGPPEHVELGEAVTLLVGANRAGTSNVAFALAAALDADLALRPRRDLPRGRGGDPSVVLRVEGGSDIEVAWDTHGGPRTVTAGPERGRVTSEPASTGRVTSGRVASDPTPPGAARPDGVTAGRVIYAETRHTPRDLLRRVPTPWWSPRVDRTALIAAIQATAQAVIPEVARVSIEDDGTVWLFDDLGAHLPVPLCRPVVALGLARHLAELGQPATATIIEAPEAFLHPAAQEDLGALLLVVARETSRPVVVTTTSPFVIPRVAEAMVVSLARDAAGRTGVIGAARGDAAQARQLGGLLRDAGLASVLDRIGRIAPGTRGVLIVEGGTDVAYLRSVAQRLGREDVLADVVLQASGGAMGAALSAIVLRAELDVRLVVLLDHDDPGRRARDTLTSRFDFDRQRQIVTYADVFEGSPPGIEAETLFAIDLLRRFAREQGPASHRGERDLHGVPHLDLTSSGKSAFVGWVAEHARLEDLARWDALLDVLDERFGGGG